MPGKREESLIYERNFQKIRKTALTMREKQDIINKQLEVSNTSLPIRFAQHSQTADAIQEVSMNLTKAQEGKEYIIQCIDTNDEELNSFLFSLGCYSGEPITVVSRRKSSCTVSIKDGRYNIDSQLAEAIIV